MSVPQPSVKWLVQNGRNVLLRNAAPDKASPSSLYNLRLDIYVSGNSLPGTLLYQSYVVPQTLNPTWTFSGMSSSEDASSNFMTASLTFKIVHQGGDMGKEQIVYSEGVDLTRLVPIKRSILDGQCALPINFLILYIGDELYTTERLYQQLTGKSTPYTGEYFTLEHDDIDEETDAAGSSLSTGAALTTANLRLKELRKDLEGTLKNAEVVRLQAIRRDKQAEIARLRAAVEAEEARLAQETSGFEEETRLFAHTEGITGLMAACQEEVKRKQEADRVLNNKKLDLLKVRFLLEARKIKLLSELQTIYPIERLDNGEYAIRGVELPADHNSKDDEQVAAALGYTVHLLLLASKYLEIPIRYQLLFMGSRSFIRDPAVGNGTTLPLFRRNVEKDRFDRAVAWLKRAAEQLLMSRGAGYEANQCLLANIQMLFQCEMCPKLAI